MKTFAEMAAESRKLAVRFREQAEECRQSAAQCSASADAAKDAHHAAQLERIAVAMRSESSAAEQLAERFVMHAERQERLV